MADTHNEGGSRWMLRYEVAVDPQRYPRVHALLARKDAFGVDFSANMERLAQEYLVAVEEHLLTTQADNAGEPNETGELSEAGETDKPGESNEPQKNTVAAPPPQDGQEG